MYKRKFDDNIQLFIVEYKQFSFLLLLKEKKRKMSKRRVEFTFNPLARLMARKGRRTRSTLKILTTEIAPDVKPKEMSDTQTTRRSSKLNADRQKAPSCSNIP